MIPQTLQRAIARITGDSLSTIRRLGFQPIDPQSPRDDGDEQLPDPSICDWDGLTSVPRSQLVAEECCDAA